MKSKMNKGNPSWKWLAKAKNYQVKQNDGEKGRQKTSHSDLISQARKEA